ncbi:MAG TPA: PD-(D/E)XK nuclease family protein [Pirellulales bacterium]|nr:PD-(D/E)XK nuclease family protein [Pirellulales bacterium]
MPAQLQILAGPARSGKTAALLARYRQILAEQGDGNISQAALWLAPTRHAAAEIRGRLLSDGLTGCFSPGVYTFEQFAQTLLLAADQPPDYLGQLLKRQLIQWLLAEAVAAGRLSYFAPIADTAGLVDLVAGIISDLKRQDVSPQRLSQLAASPAGLEKTREIAALYAEYQRRLNQHHMVDVEGRFAAVGKLLRETPPEKWGPFGHLQHVVLDGFTDFTRSQHEVLQLLAKRLPALKELTITLPLENESGRADLFWKPQHTLEQLQDRHPKWVVQWQPRQPAGDWPALAQLERQLFVNPRNAQPAADSAGIEIIATSGQKAEIELLARRIKNLLVQGEQLNAGQNSSHPQPIRPGDIAVVFRSLETVAALVDEVFSEYGIPVAIDLPPRLIRSPGLQALAAILRLQAADWPFRQLLAVVANNYFQPAWPQWQAGEAATAVEWAIRQLQVPAGRKELLSALQWRAKSDKPAPQSSPDGDPLEESDAQLQAEHRRRYGIAHQVLSQLDQTLPSPHKARSLTEWIGILQGVAEHLGLLHGVQNSPAACQRSSSLSDYDRPAWQRLKTVLAVAAQLEQRLDEGHQPAAFTLRDFVARLQDILSVEALPVDLDSTGRVRVLAAPSIRAISVPYLFVAGMAEKVFPPPVRDDRIYTEAEYRSLNDAGLNFADHRQRSCEEMLLFYEVATRPTRQLVLSYPALDEKAQPLSPSPYMTELQRCLEIESKLEINLSPVPPSDQPPYSPTELRVKAVAQWLENKPQLLARLLSHPEPSTTEQPQSHPLAMAPGLLAGLQSIAARSRRDGFGPFEGLLTGAAAQRHLQHRFGPDHCWSVSRLEEYAYCPYKFFAQNVLGLEELPELTLEIDYGRRGLLAHDALAILHRRLLTADQRLSPADVAAEEYAQHAADTLKLLSEKISQGTPFEVALQTIDLQLITQWLEEYLAQHQSYDQLAADVASAAGAESANGMESAADQPLRPAYFEVSFGLKPREGPEIDHKLSTDKPFDLRCGAETVRLSGRIDRIDIGLVGGHVVFNVLDYKTGGNKKFKLQDFQSGLALQLPLYALAVQDLLLVDRRAVPWRVGYWYLREKGFESHGLPQLFEPCQTGLRETAHWQSLRGEILARVVSLVHGIRGGAFPVFSADEECTNRCQFSTVCRVHQIRALGKTSIASHSTAPAEIVGALP